MWLFTGKAASRTLGVLLCAVGVTPVASPAAGQASGSAWEIGARGGACLISRYTPEGSAAGVAALHGITWKPGEGFYFVLGGPRDFKASESEVAVQINGGSGIELEGVAELGEGDDYRFFALSTPDRKDASSLLAGDLTFTYANAGAIRRYTVPLAQQLPRIRNCMAKAKLQAREAPARAAVSTPAPARASRDPASGEIVSTGSGVFVSTSGQLLTNAHVIEGCRAVTSPGLGSAEMVAVDEASDLALLRFARRPRGVVAVRPETPKLGEAVLVAGYPLSSILVNGLNITGGNISALAGLEGDRRMIQITAPIQPGNSGGPVLDGSGRLVAIVRSSLDLAEAAPQNINWAVAPFVVSAFLQENGVSYAEGRRGKLSPQAVADQAKAHTVLLQCRA